MPRKYLLLIAPFVLVLVVFFVVQCSKSHKPQVPSDVAPATPEEVVKATPTPTATPVEQKVAKASPTAFPTPEPVIVKSSATPMPTPQPIVEGPTPAPTAVPEKNMHIFVIDRSDTPVLTPEGLGLIVEYEVGGESQYKKWPHPEYSGGASGVTWGIGYDGHQNSKTAILSDWKRIGERPAQRLAATQPYSGSSAKVHYRDVVDITVPWQPSIEVFLEIDVSRTDVQCRRAFPGFDSLRPKAKDAIRSLVFNRGAAMNGPNRVEMRWMRDVGVPKKDYDGLAAAERDMKKIWRGTSIQAGMYRRREAEARLFETP